MSSKVSLENSLDLIAAVVAVAALFGVLQTFVIGKHIIIPTMILFFCIVFGNLARYGLRDKAWAKQVLFWIFFIFTWHLFFALFFAKKYREVLGGSFEPVFGVLLVVFAFLVIRYAQKNAIFR